MTGILATLGGVVMVAFSDASNRENENIWGDLLALISAITYAIYVTLFKRAVKNEERVNNAVFLGR
jgi:solute carrier family 35 protein F5